MSWALPGAVAAKNSATISPGRDTRTVGPTEKVCATEESATASAPAIRIKGMRLPIKESNALRVMNVSTGGATWRMHRLNLISQSLSEPGPGECLCELRAESARFVTRWNHFQRNPAAAATRDERWGDPGVA